jgi:hypothetical protein
MDGGGFDGARARRLRCRSLGLSARICMTRTFERFVRVTAHLGADFHGSAPFCRHVNFGSQTLLSPHLVEAPPYPSPCFRASDRAIMSEPTNALHTTSLRAFYVFFMHRLFEWERSRSNARNGRRVEVDDRSRYVADCESRRWAEAGSCGISVVSLQARCFSPLRLGMQSDATG